MDCRPSAQSIGRKTCQSEVGHPASYPLLRVLRVYVREYDSEPFPKLLLASLARAS